MKVTDIVKAIIKVSEKGANIARIIRSEQTLLELLVQEKKGDQKNQRFVQDFKTLADVLVQEMVRHDLSEQFPGISDSIYGEESNKFTNALGESIVVQILSSKEATSQMLVLDHFQVSLSARRIDAKVRAEETRYKRSTKRALEDETASITELFELSAHETMDATRSFRTAQGVVVEKLQERYKGIEVFDSSVVVETDENGRLTGDTSGSFIQGIENDVQSVEPKISPQEALDIAVDMEGDRDILDTDITPTTPLLKIYLDENSKARLVYYLQYMAVREGAPKQPAFFIDANSGEVISRWNNLESKSCDGQQITAFGGNNAIGKISYGEYPYCLDMKVEGDTCYLENKHVKVIDLMGTYNLTLDETVSFLCSEGYNDTINGAYSPAMDAFFYGTVLGRMFEEWFQSTPLREKVLLKVHYGERSQFAFYTENTVVFGDGNTVLYPLVTPDISCHEVGHGVTGQSSGLVYTGHSGGLNEAFSDILGEACEHYISQSNDFVIGTGLFKDLTKYIRSMEHQSEDGYSVEHIDDYNNNVGPHSSSGIFNRAFFLVVRREVVDLRQAVKAFYYANTVYWHQRSSFEGAACGVLKSAYDLGQTLKTYIRAFRDVGIETCNITSHIRSLKNNRTYHNITVSSESQPLFAFQYHNPAWWITLVINATSSRGQVGIKYRIATWDMALEDIDDAASMVNTDSTNTVNILGETNNVVFFKLFSLTAQVMDDVTVTARL